MVRSPPIYVHTEWFVSLLQTTAGEELERVDVAAKVELAPLPRPHGEGGNVGVRYVDSLEGDLLTQSVHHQLPIEGETWQEIYVQDSHMGDNNNAN